MLWVGIWKYNGLQDAVAAHVSLWPDSLLPEDRRPSEMQAMATRVGAKVAEKILDSSHHLTRKD